MKNHKLELMKRVLKPVSKERLAEIVRARTPSTGFEQLTLQDAGIELEVQSYIANIEARQNPLLTR